MLKRFYTGFVFRYPRTVIALVLLTAALLGTQAVKLSVDASAETLLLENDKDLAYTRLVAKRYRGQDFLVVTYTPDADLLAPQTLDNIRTLSAALLKIDGIDSVNSILNVPLLESPPKPVKELLEKIPSIEAGDANLTLAREEFKHNPLYVSNLVSPDLKTTALQVNLVRDDHYYELLDRLNALRAADDNGTLTAEGRTELADATAVFKAYRDVARERDHRMILAVRDTLRTHQAAGQLFLGGVTMIADDMVTFVKRDLKTYGVAVLALLILVLWTVFRQKRWVALPVLISALSIGITVGLLGMLGFEITVISSNFISLQLIITISIIIHLIVRYRELALTNPAASEKELVLESTLSMSKPTFFAIITTIAGFASLMLSGIKPVIALGWMMSIGISVSLIVTYLLFPAVNVLLKRKQPKTTFDKEFSVTKILATFTERHGAWTLMATVLLIAFSVTGAQRLVVENSFINYFKPTTEIYQGMSVIDRQLGGTTPLDITIDLPQPPTAESPSEPAADSAAGFDEFDEFAEEFNAEAKGAQYWFTENRMEVVRRVHEWLESVPHVGKVLSLGTMLEVGRTLNHGRELDNFELALLYNEMPAKFADIILKPYVSIEHDQARFALRIIDSDADLRRADLLKELHDGLINVVGIPPEHLHISGLMVLYNNMLQSLFESQIATLGVMAVLLFLMFWALFRSFLTAVVAIIANLVPVGTVFGVMGWSNIPLDMMTITIAAISIGIAVDDTIHYIHRFRIELARDGDYVAAMHRSHESIGYAMSYTSAAIMIGFVILVLSVFIPTIYFGLLTVLVMFMAIVADLMLLPKLILLLRPFGQVTKKVVN
ncbi:MMPL family transporter [Sulfurimonas sp. HSL-3221]|uniref:efflux RND transporter permease subunit n=1 Tax=Thiomicrolovo TaxID=3451667 RepID=UPI001E5EF4F2|nr:MMPL family transporter [Sulfurimonas sp. HSL-3221]UFS61368.1 MMPL family transporter [Sulfurimonas sp. HSL-3221]